MHKNLVGHNRSRNSLVHSRTKQILCILSNVYEIPYSIINKSYSILCLIDFWRTNVQQQSKQSQYRKGRTTWIFSFLRIVDCLKIGSRAVLIDKKGVQMENGRIHWNNYISCFSDPDPVCALLFNGNVVACFFFFSIILIDIEHRKANNCKAYVECAIESLSSNVGNIDLSVCRKTVVKISHIFQHSKAESTFQRKKELNSRKKKKWLE